MLKKYRNDSKLVVSNVSIRTSNSKNNESSVASIKMTLEFGTNESNNSMRINNVKNTYRLGSMITKPPKAYALQGIKNSNNRSK